MKFGRTLKWMLFWLIVIGVGGAGTVWWYWQRSDRMLKEMVLEKLQAAAPDWEISLGDASFDWENQSRVFLTDLRLRPPGETSDLLTIPTTVVTIDGDRLRSDLQLVVRRLEIRDPRLRLVRETDGTWNLDRLKFATPDGAAFAAGFPELALERAAIEVVLNHAETSFATTLSITRSDLRLIPKAREFYLIEGGAELRNAGLLQLSGEWDLASKRWRVDGAMQDLEVDQRLLELLTDVSPPSREKLHHVDQRLRSFAQRASADPTLTLDRVFDAPAADFIPERMTKGGPERLTQGYSPLVQAAPLVQAGHQTGPAFASIDSRTVPDFGLSGSINLNFRLSQSPDEPIDYRVLCAISSGQLDNPVLPFSLRDVECKAYLDRTQFLLRDFRAVNGSTEITLAADFGIIGKTFPGTIEARVVNLPVTERLKRFVKPDLHKIYDLMHPTGNLDIVGTLRHDGFGHWEPRDVVYTLKDGTARPDPFSYPIHEIRGTVIPRTGPNGDIHFMYDFQGLMGRRPAKLTGVSRPMTQGGEARFDLWVQDLPIDDTFVTACTPQLRSAVTSLNLQGKVRAHVRLHRPAGENQKYQQEYDVSLSGGAMEFEKFAYPIDNLSGEALFDSKTGNWQFSKISGRHGDAKMTASATMTKVSDSHRLELRMVLEDAPIDHALERAMRDNYQRLWDELNPQGRVTAMADVVWMPERNLLDISLPSIRVQNGSLLLREFRYALDGVESLLSYDDGKVDIREFKARHDETQIRAEGEFVQEAGDLWRLRFEKIIVDDLQPDRQFRKALPVSMRDALETLDPEGPVSIEGRTLEFRGSNRPDSPVTAYWDLTGYVAGMNLIAGVQVKNAHGKFTAQGTWDGRIADGGGRIELGSAVVMGQLFSNILGPYRVRDRMINVGSARAFADPSRTDLPDEHLTAEAFKGTVELDAIARIGEDRRDPYGRIPVDPTRYKVLLTISGVRLEEYARRNLAGASDLRGIVNGRMQLEGTGDNTRDMTGNGVVRIEPAALYQLPIMLQVFQRLSFVPPDNTAFDEAFLEFNVRNEQFEFSRIDLRGNALSLRGRGTVRFDEKVDLEFFSSVPKAQLPIPVVRELLNASSNGLVAVSVDGTIAQPITRVQSNMVLDRAMRDFLGTFQPFAPFFQGNGTQPPLRPGSTSFFNRPAKSSGEAIVRTPEEN